jgi:hypothetical protein
MTELKPYTSGYMKPPKEHRFKKGKSGNPRGRPKEPETVASIILRVLKRKIRIAGEDRRVSLLEAIALRLRNLAIKGYLPALEILRDLESQTSASRQGQVPEDWSVRIEKELEESGLRIVNGEIMEIEKAESREASNA